MADTLGAMVNTIFASRNLPPEELLEFVHMGEEGGLTSFWAGDHLNWYVPVLECLTTLSFLAGHTNARLGTNVIVPALRQPYLLAKMAGTIDYLAPGGLDLGVGIGGEHPVEFHAADVPVQERAPRTDEAIDLLRDLLVAEEVDFDGRFYRVQGARVEPGRPLRILVGGRSEPALRRIVERGDGWTAAWVTPSQVRRVLERLGELALDHGRDPGDLRSVVHIFARIGSDVDREWSVAAAFLRSHYNADPAPFRRYCVLGPVGSVGEQLREFMDTPLDELLVSFMGPDPLAQMELYADAILPHLLSGLIGTDTGEEAN